MKEPIIEIDNHIAGNKLVVFSWLILLLTIVYVVIIYRDLPDEIPMHYQLDGSIDRYGNKSEIVLLLVIDFAALVVLNFLQKKPHIYNYPIPVTLENAAQLYRYGTALIAFLSLAVSIIFGAIIIITVLHKIEDTTSFMWWFLPLCLLLTIVPSAYYTFKMFSVKKMTNQ